MCNSESCRQPSIKRRLPAEISLPGSTGYDLAMARVHQINVSDGGVPKRPAAGADVLASGLVGDTQADKVHHGGPDQAICLFSLEVIERFRSEGHPIQAGSAGENITVAGLDWATLGPGARLAIGDQVELEITSYTSPCQKNALWFREGDFTRMLQSRHPGEARLYAKVISEGHIASGDKVQLLSEDPA